ncbi:MAG: ABC transporter permease, partial [archaeon]
MIFIDTLIKEAKQLSKDKGFLLIAFLQPIIFIVMFGSSFESGDVNHLDTIVIDEDMTLYSSYVIDAVNRSEYYDIMPYSGSYEEARDLMRKEKVRGVFRVRKGFGENIENSKTGEIDVLVDSSIFLVYLAIMGARGEVVGDTLYNISENIFLELEDEKEKGKGKVEEIKSDLDDIEIKTNELDLKFEAVRADFDELNIEGIEEDLDDLKDGLNAQGDGMEDVQDGVQGVEQLITNLQVVGADDETMKALAIVSLQNLSEGLREIISANDDIESGVNEMSMPIFN